MYSEKQLKRVTDLALAHSKADQTEVILIATDLALTRFANNYIHQNIAQKDTTLSIRAVVGKKVGIVSANSLESEAVRRAVETAQELARHQVENQDFRSLPVPRPISQVDGFVEATARLTPAARARMAGVVCRRAKEAGLVAAGSISRVVSRVVVANSLGLFAQHASTSAEMTALVMGDSGSGYAHRLCVDAAQMDAESVAEEAVGRARRGQNPIALPPGEYPVVLQPYAVSDILDFFGYLSFGAQAYHEGRSFMSGKLGQRAMGENIRIWDDGLSLETVPFPFDFEGVPKRRVDFILDGMAKEVCYDSYTAGKEGKESTGHALPPEFATFGPMPGHLFLGVGDAPLEDMVSRLDKGLLVTRFHYTRVVEPMRVMMTGMTRDGTFLVERGAIVAPVKNLRFTQSYLEAMNRVEAIGCDARLVRTAGGPNFVPALKIAGWNFTGATEF
ncbi:MAG: TldD/PmbA family protein [Chloroflexi bacterium]|nr:TldD/PmbA family protein [Chloroflexota bacterium]